MYADLINRAINAVHQKGVATRILQGMDRTRNRTSGGRLPAGRRGAVCIAADGLRTVVICYNM